MLLKRMLTLCFAIGLSLTAADLQESGIECAGKAPTRRPRVTAIFLSLAMPDGTVRNLSLDPAEVEALFFSERAVKEMLGGFYENYAPGKALDKTRILQHYGPKGSSLLEGQETLPLNKGSLLNLWNTPLVDGTMPAVLGKSITCVPAPIH